MDRETRLVTVLRFYKLSTSYAKLGIFGTGVATIGLAALVFFDRGSPIPVFFTLALGIMGGIIGAIYNVGATLLWGSVEPDDV